MRRNLVTCLSLATSMTAQTPAPVEHGLIAWERDFAAAQARAKSSGRPMLVLFQEVPG